MRKIFLTSLLFLQLCQYIVSQDIDSGLVFDLTVRYRFELWDGFNSKNYGDDGPDAIGKLNDKFLLQRIIPGLIYNKGKISAAFHMQDSRAFGWSLSEKNYPDLYRSCEPGSETSYYMMNPQEEFFEIYDLYFEYRELIKNLSVKIGRQKIFYGDWKIFEMSQWGNTGRYTWDAIKVSYRKNDEYIDIFGGGTKTHDPHKTYAPFTHLEYLGGGIYAHKNLTPWLNAETFYALKTQGTADYIKTLSINRNWIGLKLLSPENQRLSYDILYAREFGSEDGKQIKAHGFGIKTVYRFDDLPATPELSMGYYYASGDKPDDDIIQTFEPVYGSRAKFHGFMGFGSWSNLSNPQASLKFTAPGKRMYIELKHMLFFIPQPQDCDFLNTMKISEGSNHLGNETNLYFRHQHNDHWQFTGVLGYFNPGDLEPINFKEPEDAFWMALQVQFTLN
jgi:hypothetical protein